MSDRRYANLFIPIELKDQIDASTDALGLRSRTEAVRMGQVLLQGWIEHAQRYDANLFDRLLNLLGKGIRINELLEPEDQ